MKFQRDGLPVRPRFDDIALDSTVADLRLISGLDQNSATDLKLISALVEQRTPPRRSPETLIKVPGLIITPDRDPRYRPPSAMTSDVMERLAKRTIFAKSLPTTLVIVAHPDDEAIGAGGLLLAFPMLSWRTSPMAHLAM